MMVRLASPRPLSFLFLGVSVSIVHSELPPGAHPFHSFVAELTDVYILLSIDPTPYISFRPIHRNAWAVL